MSSTNGNMNVLLVTDNQSLVASVQEYLAGSAYSVTACAGKSGITESVSAALGKEPFDIVIIDMIMLVYAGRGLIREVKMNNGKPEIILIAGPGSASIAKEYLKKESSDCIQRPVNKDHLLALLDQAADRRLNARASREPDPYRQTSLVDSLTGLYNRSYFRERVMQEVSVSRRKKKNFSVLLMEIKDLQKINKDFGRKAGDDVLKSVSEYIQDQCRGSDTVARCGGDEFGIILSEASSEAARKIADRIIASVSAGKLQCINNGTVCASIGISSYPQIAADSRDLLTQADSALRHSRTSGENSYTLYESGLNGSPA
jgi:diguanylate cyclase (GGDEF)-like protein